MILKERIDGVSKVVFDLKELRYILSAGLRVLIATHKLMMKKGSMTVRNVSSGVMEIF